MAGRVSWEGWRAGLGPIVSALGVACGVSGSPSDVARYEGPNFYESGQAANAAPLPEPAAATDFLSALLQDGSVAPACAAGQRVADDPSLRAAGVECPAVSHPTISALTFAPGGSPSSWGAEAAFPGGTFFYPDATAALTSDVTANDWHLSGTVGQLSGFGLFLRCSPTSRLRA